MRPCFACALFLAFGVFDAIIVAAWIAQPSAPRFHWQALVIPVLMLVDYQLTLTTARRVRSWNATYDLARLELNPMWKRDVANLRTMNFRHLAIVFHFGVLMFWLSQAMDVAEPEGPRFFMVILGIPTGLLAAVSAHHLLNLSVLAEVKNRPAFLRLQLTPRRHGVLSLENYVTTIGLAALVLVMSALPPAFAVGGIAGIIVERLIRWRFMREAARNDRLVHS